MKCHRIADYGRRGRFIAILFASYLIDVLRRLPPPPRGVPALSHFRALADVPRNLLFLDPLILPRNLHLRRRPPPETLLASRTPWTERHIRLGMQWVELRGFEFAFIFQDVHMHFDLTFVFSSWAASLA